MELPRKFHPIYVIKLAYLETPGREMHFTKWYTGWGGDSIYPYLSPLSAFAVPLVERFYPAVSVPHLGQECNIAALWQRCKAALPRLSSYRHWQSHPHMWTFQNPPPFEPRGTGPNMIIWFWFLSQQQTDQTRKDSPSLRSYFPCTVCFLA